ncbi:hypothetical protein [Caulobacter sp. NIBR2454]|uniref:hypothetical protein n=1 Tax=Caulobacter sp. NIBR2454 TaxID=3015996 RepID=UPI0022B69D32|nr:hypothetical protein [Caulobacter sp. NIBR2454]
MRLVLASLITAATFGVAVAQDATTPPPVEAAPAPAATPDPAMPAPAPTDPMAAPAAPAAEAPPVAPAPITYPDPTDPTSIAIISALNSICVPGVQDGGDQAALAKAAGFKKKRDQWILAQAKPYQILVEPAGSNKNVCTLVITHPTGLAQTLVTDLHGWASTREPVLQLYRNDQMTGADFKRTTVSWEHVGEGTASTGMVFVQLKKPDGSSVLKNADQSNLLYSVRK